ncbi:MAG: hypothetical protein PHW66_01725 [Gallionella sp.]|nr:hypothetical protein [Gallionella sp.]
MKLLANRLSPKVRGKWLVIAMTAWWIVIALLHYFRHRERSVAIQWRFVIAKAVRPVAIQLIYKGLFNKPIWIATPLRGSQ